MTATACPTHDHLRRLASGELADPLAEDTADHISQCTRCQEVIESVTSSEAIALAGGEVRVIDLVGSDAIDPPEQSVFWKRLSEASDSSLPVMGDDDTHHDPAYSATVEMSAAGSDQSVKHPSASDQAATDQDATDRPATDRPAESGAALDEFCRRRTVV